MANDEHTDQLGLDVDEPREETGKAAELLNVPMLGDNLALALSGGFLASKARTDAMEDVQSLHGRGTVGFAGQVPYWAVAIGEESRPLENIAIIEVSTHDLQVTERGPYVEVETPIPVSRINRVNFASVDAAKNFVASYKAFPDVPVENFDIGENPGLFEWQDRDPGLPDGFENPGHSVPKVLGRLDMLGGFLVCLRDLLADDGHDEELTRLDAALGMQGPGTEIDRLLGAVHDVFADGESSEVDGVVWRATAKSVLARKDDRGFDPRQVIAEVLDMVNKQGIEEKVRADVEKWARFCNDVVDAHRDMPGLPDKRVGRRAALALLVARDLDAHATLASDSTTGKRVAALSRLAIGAFIGLSRTSKELKSPSAAGFAAVLELAQKVATGTTLSVNVSVEPVPGTLDMLRKAEINGTCFAEQCLEPGGFTRLIQSMALGVELALSRDVETSELFVEKEGEKVFVTREPRSTGEKPVVRMFVVVKKMPARAPLKVFRKYLELGWQSGSGVGVVKRDEFDYLCCYETQLQPTFDRDEFPFHLHRLVGLSKSLRAVKNKA
jgi:hypothetical protein